ncbi:MAG: hypothetical protein ABIG31_00810 [Candidatus Omnitrophota bacterium]
MASYLRRFLTSLKRLLLIGLILTALSTVICNFIFAPGKQALTQATRGYLTQELSVSRPFYLPPHFIILRNLAFAEAKHPEENQILKAPLILIRFSLKEFFVNKRLVISHITCYRLKGDSVKLAKFVSDNFSAIIDFLRSLPWKDIRFSLKGGCLDLVEEAGIPSFLAVHCDFKIQGESLSAQGYIRKDRGIGRKARGAPLQYSLQGMLSGEGLVFNKVRFERENFRSQFWGNTDGKNLQLNGFAFANTLFKETYTSESAWNKIVHLVKKIELFKRKPKKSAELTKLPKANFYLLDLDCRLRADFPKVRLEHMSFSLNNIPFSLKGDISLDTPLGLDLAISSYLGNLKDAKKENFKKIDLKITGILKGGLLSGNVLLNFDFLKKGKDAMPLEQLQGKFKGLSLSFDKYPLLELNVKDSDLFCKTDTNEYRVALRDFHALVNFRNKRLKLAKFKALLYDGFLYGQGRIDTQNFFPKITGVVRVRDVSAQKLDGLLIHFSKVFGNLSSTMVFRNDPDLDLRGRVSVQKGYLNNFEFFKWLAQLFNIPRLKRIDFDKASSHFSVNKKGAGLQRINLKSQDVGLKGYFGLGQHDLVSSQLALTFTRGLLELSPKFTPLLRLVGKDLAAFCFEFQLSGILHKMNFRWLQSDFKNRLQNAIPNFIERRIDKNIEEATKAISVEP